MPCTTFSSDCFKTSINFACGFMGFAAVCGFMLLSHPSDVTNPDPQCIGQSPCESLLFGCAQWLMMSMVYGVKTTLMYARHNRINMFRQISFEPNVIIPILSGQGRRGNRLDYNTRESTDMGMSTKNNSCRKVSLVMAGLILTAANFIPEIDPGPFYKQHGDLNTRVLFRLTVWVSSVVCSYSLASLVYDRREINGNSAIRNSV